MSKSKYDIIHEKAIRLIEGGVVEVDGLSVRAINIGSEYECCEICDMDCLCLIDTEMLKVCEQCDWISAGNYYLKLVNAK